MTVEQIFSLGSADPIAQDESANTPAGSAGPSEVAPSSAQSAKRSGSGATRRSSGASRSHRSGAPGGLGMGTTGAGIGVLDVVFAPFRLVLGLLSGVWYLFSKSTVHVDRTTSERALGSHCYVIRHGSS